MKKTSFTLLCSAASLLVPGIAMAQTSPVAGESASAASEDIIVTARKRNESILTVPVVMTAITQESIEKYSTHDLYTVAARVPGLLIGTSLAANGIQASMRGIGTIANNATIDNSISLNVDGVQLSQGLAYNIGVFDVGQVEVLKGPQALFFGKNSPAGVISLRSADPTDKFEVIAKAGYEFEAKEKVGELVVSGPVSDTLKLRAGVKYSDQSGFFTNRAVALPGFGSIDPTDRRVTPTKDLILRGTAIWSPLDNYTARLKVSYEDQKQEGTWPPFQIALCPEGLGRVVGTNIPFNEQDNCQLDRTIRLAWPDPTVFTNLRNGGKPFNHLKQALASLEQTVNLTDHLTLTSLTGFYKMSQEYMFLASVSAGAMTLVSDSGFKADQLTQEVRFASSFDGPINFTTGAFYQDGNQFTRVVLKGNRLVGLPSEVQNNRHYIDINSVSFFGQVNYKITPQLELAPGVRWTTETRKHTQYQALAGQTIVTPFFTPLLDPRIASTNWSPEVSLTYTPTTDLTIFGAYKTGFKSGSFNGTIFAAPTTPTSFGDEKVKGGEVGTKARLLDRQLAFNAAVYYYRYSGLQVGASEIQGQTIINRTLNAASAKVKGLDLDATFSPRGVPGFTIYGSVNYNHARYGKFTNAPCGNGQSAPQGCNLLLNPSTGRFTAQDLTGKRLVRAPSWMGNAGVDYEMPVNDRMKIAFGTFANYSGSYSTTLVNLPGFEQRHYIKANATIALKEIDNRWELSLIGNNLNNRITTGNCFNSNSQNGSFGGGQIQGGPAQGVAGGDEMNCVAERGREVWLRLSVKLGN